ncbi:hypothetical protein B0T25DRAFT_593558 [Lasiosphaeria hispida]|uniref:Protein kinase domain-containing protein n=1 Tax=Lasiosphaeria hispida TaxID=260671 RepID=A0AAJ0M9U8_9PEZI|nr:hypothetical protein B0T25DRAFT_593558 [Lasiosphaeria hispida]
MDPFALVSAVGTCYEYANWIIDFCQTWKNADEEVAERVNIIESCWAKTRLQVMLIQRTRPIMDAELLRVLDESLDILREKLTLAVAKLQNVQDNKSEMRPGFFGFRRKARGDKWALEKDTLDSVIRDLEDWQRRCDPSWFLIMRIANPVIDEELQKAEATAEAAAIAARSSRRPPSPSPLSLAGGIRDALRRNVPHRSVFLPEMPLDTVAIPFSTAKTARKKTPSDQSSSWYILDTLKLNPGPDSSAMTDDVRDLARKLKHADPFAFGLLGCVGAVRVFERVPQTKEKRLAGFELVFRAPGGVTAEALCSLRDLLVRSVSGGTVPSLTRRVYLAQELAQSVSYMHTFDFVHKNICPESVLLVNSKDADPLRNRRSSFLVGFGSFRSAEGGTRLLGDEAWERNIYRHPERQGENPSQKFKMQHDIYSLGVCLLEIGLWQSFVEYSDSATPMAKFGTVCQDFVDKFIREHQVAVGASQLGIAFFFFKDYLVDLARVELPHRMGERYSEVVITCLTCLDTDSDGFGDLSDQAEYTDGIPLGVRFLEMIHIRLDEIVL